MKHAKLTLGPRQAHLLLEIGLMGLADMEDAMGSGERFSQRDYEIADEALTKLAQAMNKAKEGK